MSCPPAAHRGRPRRSKSTRCTGLAEHRQLSRHPDSSRVSSKMQKGCEQRQSAEGILGKGKPLTDSRGQKGRSGSFYSVLSKSFLHSEGNPSGHRHPPSPEVKPPLHQSPFLQWGSHALGTNPLGAWGKGRREDWRGSPSTGASAQSSHLFFQHLCVKSEAASIGG